MRRLQIKEEQPMFKTPLQDIANVVKVDPIVRPNKPCGVSAGVAAAWRTANVEPGSTVSIFGLGSIGLAVPEGARLCGATRIIGMDLSLEKFEIGEWNFLWIFPLVINEMTNGSADYCFECVGSASLMQEAYACCRQVSKPKSDIPILLKRYMDKELLLNEFVSHETRFEDINEALDKFFSFVFLWFVMFPVSLNYSSDYLYLKRKLK
ncbi:hypothetical protein Patl1_09440 [Pistacia atlantica]|uniref:Uncharacterized protein n=1 Tax=Pistacia atlantica TaxID=434234 RepID=A0ACC1AGS6_9ROSI|nr:hypothetical protein Patl1_09440 [Pistacia atlantica]